MHFADALGEFSLLDLVFESHLYELLVVFLVVFFHLLKVKFGPHQLDFGLV